MSDTTKALLLGVVEGLTEFIPVSSTGHLILCGHLLEFSGAVANVFEVFIQLGAILAVVSLYPGQFISLLPWRPAQHDNALVGLRGLLLLLVAAAPALFFGLLLHDFVKMLFTPKAVAIGLIAGAGLLYWGDRLKVSRHTINSLTYREALIVGCFQILALWPGMSRSGSTIVGGLFAGLDRVSSARFSFLLAVPVISAAALYDLYKNFHFLEPQHFSIFAVGFLTSFVVGYLAMRGFVSFLSNHSMGVFVLYRVFLGLVVLIFFN